MSFEPPSLPNRRRCLQSAACGFGSLALAALTNGRTTSAASNNHLPHHLPKAKRVIFLFMQGGVSQVDSFDHKPELQKRDGQSMSFEDARILANTGSRLSSHRIMRSPWSFRRYGQSERWVSDLFPETARHIDDLCLVHSMHTNGVAHGPATLFLHCGATQFIRPSFGSWLLYGLGSENENLPGFITIAPSIGNGGSRNYGSAFLPARYQGSAVGSASSAAPGSAIDASRHSFKDLRGSLQISHLNSSAPSGLDRDTRALVRRLHLLQHQPNQLDTELDAVIASYEMAWRMQSEAPDRFDLESESPSTHRLYGIGQQPTDEFGRRCLLARKLSEAGVRFVQVNYGDNSANPAWDQHSDLPKHALHAKAVDLPIAGLLQDLKQRGLLEDTLVWWGGEFGRTPYAEKNGTGRDHNPGGFTVWLAGGGVHAGYSHGQTDEFGSAAIEGKVHMHDLHATILHLLGLDHQRLTFRHSGRDYRLTDVFGRVVPELLGATSLPG